MDPVILLLPSSSASAPMDIDCYAASGNIQETKE